MHTRGSHVGDEIEAHLGVYIQEGEKCSCHTHHCTMSSDSTADKHRLPTNVVPRHYELTICTDLQALKFHGSVVVQYVFYIQCGVWVSLC